MLKALEVHGFKSFADRTRFEFPPGITVVVGPNGSGKSNVVDALKWVLGEQSVKSLRGKEMSDVIFKGSGGVTGGRKPLNSAEATVVFDNSSKLLPIDAPEVHVTRRVYRSGEGEYLINREPCRLKDVKDLFRGTGVGVDAYSIIEQGKVERMLQASAKDRRSMFEEAAGISRFKAKKVETQRRLERVEQNLLRLRDIVEEVDARLKNVRAQASKASRYREYDSRLRALRVRTAGGDWRTLNERRTALSAALVTSNEEIALARGNVESIERRLRQEEEDNTRFAERLRAVENEYARIREHLAAREAACEFDRARIAEWDQEIARSRRQSAAMTLKAGDARTQLRDLATQLSQAEADYEATGLSAAEEDRKAASLVQEQKRLRSEIDTLRRDYVAAIRRSADLANQADSCAKLQEAARDTIERCEERYAIVSQALAAYEDTLAELRAAATTQETIVEERRAVLEADQLQLDQYRLALSERQEDLSHLRGKYNGVFERCAVIHDLEQRREGWESGVREFLEYVRSRGESVFASVVGITADLMTAPPQTAQAIDLALGETAQAVVVRSPSDADTLLALQRKLGGRVCFVGLWPETPSLPAIDLTGRPGVVGRADRLVIAAEEHRSLAERLLGRTWIVETLNHAVRLRSEGAADCRFTTLTGERLEADGTLVCGAGLGSAGLISRRSELRQLENDAAVYKRLIEESEEEALQLRGNITAQEIKVRRLTEEYRDAAAILADRQVAVRAHEQQGERLAAESSELVREKDSAAKTAAESFAEIKRLRIEQESVDRELRENETETIRLDTLVTENESVRSAAQKAAAAARVELARCEQRLDDFRLRRFQCEEDHRERERLLTEARDRYADCLAKKEAAELAVLAASQETAIALGEKERFAAETIVLAAETAERSALRTELASQLRAVRGEMRKSEERIQEQRLALQAAEHELQTLCDRLREDYGLEASELQATIEEEDARPRSEIEAEMNALRKKLNAIGSVNLEALEELDALEERHKLLSSQYDDLAGAKHSLEKIIHKINAESRRIFLETLESIRANFQVLYRRAFGGGKADLALEEGVDVLESGVEIVATPPGKPSFNNSLLSGGEKALTAVALLLAIFQFRPSPFCVLDEVDAPFDEANIGRFMEVLKEFLGWTRFIIVTHSKKTMTAADTLYGVTMQESGVSKRVSVRFEDVSDDGRISREALEREASGDRTPRGVA